MKTAALLQHTLPFASLRVSLMTLLVASLLNVPPIQIGAAEIPARPTLKELKPLMQKAATAVFEALEVPVREVEVIEIGAPGWAPLTAPESEVVFWPVKVKCTITTRARDGAEELGLIFRVYRAGTEWKADTTEVYTVSRLQVVIKSRQTARKFSCIANLRQLDGAKQVWALENRKRDTETPSMADLVTGKYLKAPLVCPDGGTYTVNPVDTKPKCSTPGHELP